MKKFEDNYKMSSNDTELIVPSIFTSDDYKRHMSVNLDTGLWQCFKSGNKGNFIQLYAFLEGLTYNNAEADILIKELDSNYDTASLPFSRKPPPQPHIPDGHIQRLYLRSVTLQDYESQNPLVQRAWAFLYERKLFKLDGDQNSQYYVSTSGRYDRRLIIPFENDSEIFYFQARTLGDDVPKYLNPSDEWPKSSHILYPYDEEADAVVVCEGPFDAISLQIQGVNATCTMGCSVSEYQVEALKDFRGKVIIGYDNDEAGQRGVHKFDYLRRIKRMADIYICHPPSEVKDWNDAHQHGWDLQKFVESHTKKYDYDYLIDHLLTTL